MLKFVALACLIAVALAGHHGHGGHSESHRKQDDYGNYRFGYNIRDPWGAVNGREEQGSHGHVFGSYYLGDIDGRHRSVQYVADKFGFRAMVKTNEPGTQTSLPAAAPYVSSWGKTIPSGSFHIPHGHGHHGHHAPIQQTHGEQYATHGDAGHYGHGYGH